MKTLFKYISLLIFSGLIIIFCPPVQAEYNTPHTAGSAVQNQTRLV
ncbi:hypothetical protein MTO98_01115 [Mucilaginibacter sp. SMC90]|nr:hypothetical protein [Mucilaginibacter sp. SMC90]UOE49669.1 hypothetical protein MTO98_01115 [Mucilaginibacter sp. SMC90]